MRDDDVDVDADDSLKKLCLSENGGWLGSTQLRIGCEMMLSGTVSALACFGAAPEAACTPAILCRIGCGVAYLR